MLENYFLELIQNNCKPESIYEGFKFPLPSSGLSGEIGIKENRTIVMMENKIYTPNSYAMFLPYVPNNINLCIQSNRDVLSAPFSGCHMVRFYYTGDCLFDKINKYCKDQKFNCRLTCKYRNKLLVGHVAYENQNEFSCEDIWENNIKRNCNNDYIDFDPFTPEIIAYINKNGYARVHGLITKDGRKFSIVINYSDEIVFFKEY